MLRKKLYFITILPLVVCFNVSLDRNPESFRTNNSRNATFKRFLETFEPNKVWEKIDKNNKMKGINKTVADEFETMLSGIDDTDDLLKVKVQNGNPRIELQKDGRRWSPHKNNPYSRSDKFLLKRRLMELIRQAMYQARYKMTVMQTLRNKYRRNSVYKMGFLMSKTDMACKMFASVSYKLHWDCSNARQPVAQWICVFDLLGGIERVLDLWFDVDLLIEMVEKNDENCRRMLKEVMSNRKYAWKFFD